MVGAFVVEGMTKVIDLVGALNPGNLGTYEGGNMLVAKMIGVTGTAGLTLALCRRVRTIFWAGAGAICMIVMRRPSLPSHARAEQSVSPFGQHEGLRARHGIDWRAAQKTSRCRVLRAMDRMRNEQCGGKCLV